MENTVLHPSPIRVVDHGFTELSTGGEKPILDLVFVHGLGGHPQKTWSTEKKDPKASAEPSQNILLKPARAFKKFVYRKTKPKGEASSRDCSSPLPPQDGTNEMAAHRSRTPRTDTETRESTKGDNAPMEKVFWPFDLLAIDFKDVHVLTFGYDSNPSSSTRNNLYTLGKSLVGRLADLRGSCPARPLIFVCHSLGGILVKFALKLAKDSTGAEANVQSIATSTWGIVFFATPHSGSDLADWGELLRRIAGVFKVTNPSLLASLNPRNDDGQLERLRDDFSKILGPRTEGKLTALNFRETTPPVGIIPSLIPASQLVVPLASAQIVGEWVRNMTVDDADHFSICKFGSRSDQTYQDFTSWLKGVLKEIEKEAAGKNNVQMTEEYLRDKQPCLESLKFQLSKKYRNPTKGTFSWVWSHSQFKNWYTRETGVVWIQGKAGSGKSTLLKHLSEEHRARCTNQTPKPMVLFFSFFSQSQGLESSMEGLIRSLLFQIINQNEALGVPAIEAWRDSPLTEDDGSQYPHWNDLDMLKKLFITTLNHGSGCNHAIIYIDALNECRDGPSMDDIAFLLDDVAEDSRGKNFQAKLAISSQPTPRLNQAFASWRVPPINLNENNTNDINTYLDSQLRPFMPLDPEFERIVREIKEKAEGVFLWVSLMWEHYLIKLLEKKSVHGEKVTKTELEAILSYPHEKLDETFRYMLGTVESSRREAATVLLKVVLCAARPLTLEELRYALAMGSPSHNFENEEDMLKCFDFPLSDEAVEKQVTSKSGGLIEIKKHTSTSKKTVQVIHDSVREYIFRLIKEGSIFPDCIAGEDGNIYLARACTNWLAVEDPNRLPPPNSDDCSSFPGSCDAACTIPFLSYAVTFWLHHLQEAEKATELSQAAFLLNDRALRLAVEGGMGYVEQGPILLKVWRQPFLMPRNSSWKPNALPVAVDYGLRLTARDLLETTGISSTEEGHISLQCAAARNDYETIVLLLKYGAQVPSSDRYFSFWFGLDTECTRQPQKSQILAMLLERGLELRPEGEPEAVNTLSVAVATANTPLIRKLVDRAIGHHMFEVYLTHGFCAFSLFYRTLPSLSRAQVLEALTALTAPLVRPADRDVARRGLVKAIASFPIQLEHEAPRGSDAATHTRWEPQQILVAATLYRYLRGLDGIVLEVDSDVAALREYVNKKVGFSGYVMGDLILDSPIAFQYKRILAQISFLRFQTSASNV